MPSGIFQNNSSQHYAGWILRKFFLKRSINRSPGNFNNLILDLPRQTVAIITKIHLFSSCLLNCCHMQSTLLKIHPCIGDTTIKKKKNSWYPQLLTETKERDAISFSTGQFYGTSYKANASKTLLFQWREESLHSKV